MIQIGDRLRHWNGDEVEITDIDWATNCYVVRNISTHTISTITYDSARGGAWYKIDSLPRCECGTSITMGKDDQPMFHSFYCKLSELAKES